MAPPPPASLPLAQRLLVLAQTLQFAWFVGHFALITSTLKFALAWITLKGSSAWLSYRIIFVSAAATYGIVVYKTLRARSKSRVPQLNVLALIADENVQYLLMALVWLFSPKYLLATLPYGIYSFFHVATYVRAALIPTLFPPKAAASTSPSESPSSSAKPPAAAPHPIAETIGNFVKGYYDSSMSVVAFLEIFLWVSLFFSALLFQRRSWILLPVYSLFLRARFSQSSHVQNSLAQIEANIDNLVGSQGTPPAARQAWQGAKDLARKFYAVTDLNKYMSGAAAPKKSS